MSILFLYWNKNHLVYLVILILCVHLLLTHAHARDMNENSYLVLTEKLQTATRYKDYIPDNVFSESKSLIDQFQSRAGTESDSLFDIKVNNQIDLLDIYISNAEKKSELKDIKSRIKTESAKYQELVDINNELKRELGNTK